MLAVLLLTFMILSTHESEAKVECPPNQNGFRLTCAFKCCKSIGAHYEANFDRIRCLMVEGGGKYRLLVKDYFCCGLEDKTVVGDSVEVLTEEGSNPSRSERFIAYGTTYQIDYTMLVIGLIVSIVLSILCSFFCCLLCNGCWLHRRRNPQLYESVNDTGFYPLCCGFGIPMGTVVFSTHPPQYRDDGLYHGSSTSSLPSSRNRVRFNEDGTPKGVLKNG
uniref:CX domain-containing protein n=1 Tax=Parascaris univalens TaxID=6257 RepID=A0A915C4T6_PARUN